MTKLELTECLDEVAELFPKFVITEKVTAIWFKHFKALTREQFRRSLDKHMTLTNKAPTVFDIRSCFQALYGVTVHQTEKAKFSVPYKKIDFCMDMHGIGFVNDELRLMAGGSDAKTCLAIVADKGFAAKVRAKIDEMVEYGRQKWAEGERPLYKWTGDHEHQIKWPHARIPDFDDDKMFEARRLNG